MQRDDKKWFAATALIKITFVLLLVFSYPFVHSEVFDEPDLEGHSSSIISIAPAHETLAELPPDLPQDVLQPLEPLFEPVDIEVLPTPPQSVKMLAFGDLLLDRYVRTLIERDGLDSVLDGLQEGDGAFFEGHDFVFANLEGPVTPTRVPTGKLYAFQFDPEFLQLLVDNHFNLVSVANNHTFDMGQQGNDDTYNYLEEWGIQAVGDARGINERSSYETTVNGYNMAFVAFNHTDFKLEIEDIVAKIQELSSRNDFVIVSIHWGVEYQHTPQAFQREWAQQMVDAGADVILGHHPHVLQGMEVVDGKPVFYSLGNFVFDQWFSEPTQETIALDLEFRKDEEGHKFVKLGFTPLRMNYSLPYFPDEANSQKIADQFYDYSFWTNESIEAYKSFFEDREWEFEI